MIYKEQGTGTGERAEIKQAEAKREEINKQK